MGLHWSTHQLTEYFAAVCARTDETAAIEAAVELAAEALDAELGAAIIGGEVRWCFGIGQQAVPCELLQVTATKPTLSLPGMAPLHASAARLDRKVSEDVLVVARVDGEFGAEERQMLQGMAQVFGLALRNLRTVAGERALLDALQLRRRLLETLLDIQRAISSRKPLQDVLSAITDGASTLLDGAFVALVITDPCDPDQLMTASTSGQHVAAAGDTPIHAAADAMSADQVLTSTGGRADAAVVAAPVHVDGDVAGCLVAVGENRMIDRRELLTAFAQQVSLALTDARTVEAMREAYHDPLTGLLNRKLFLDRLQHALAAISRQGDPLTVLFVDLDRFKAVNDSLGHNAGDELLAMAADRITQILRTEDSAARLGGDEFGIILEATNVANATLVARRVIRTLADPFRIGGRDVFIGASIGVAQAAGAVDALTLLGNADVAMYRAKKLAGTDRIIVFEQHMHDEASQQMALQTDLQHAFTLGQLSLHYQPLIRLDTGRTVAVEALLRWNHPRGAVPPSVFVPMAEETGLIVDIGGWVLRESTRQVIEWRRFVPDLALNVNVSPRQIMDRQLVSDTAGVLAVTSLPANALTLELTETVLVSDPHTARHRFDQLKALGVRVAFDDFGTGYSALSYLREFPVDEVKIDRTFIAGICDNAEDLAVVRAIADLARSLRLRTVAEGIENAAQLTLLRELNCGFGQGYHICRPLDSEAMTRRLNASATAPSLPP